MKGVSPIFSAILLFIIAIAIAATVIIFIWSSYTRSQSTVYRIAAAAQTLARTRLSIVYTGYGRHRGFIALLNTGETPIEILSVYVNSTPTSAVYTQCDDGSTYYGTPILIKPGSLCIVEVWLGPPALYEVALATRYTTITVPIAG